MRYLAILLLTPGAAQAWEFTTDPVCTIWHDTGEAEMRVTYDPRLSEPYAIAVTLAGGTWQATTPYAIRFAGGMGYTITTSRHRLSDDQTAVIAEDQGFGNVLNGLASNVFAVPILGSKSVQVPLNGAAEAVEAFRNCTVPGIS